MAQGRVTRGSSPCPAGILAGVNYAQLLFSDFSLILCGYLVYRYTALHRTVWEPVEALVYFFLFPVLLFHSIVKSPLDLRAASSLISAGWMLGLTGIALAYALPRLGRHTPRRDHAATGAATPQYQCCRACASW